MADVIVAIASLAPSCICFGWAGKLALSEKSKGVILAMLIAGLACAPTIQVHHP